MPNCSVSCCKKRSDTSSIQKDGVTFHIFPKNSQLRDIWKQFCNNKRTWQPKRTSVICSTHFQLSDFQNLANCNGRRRLVKCAVPTLVPNCNCSDTPCCSIQSSHPLRVGPPCPCSQRLKTPHLTSHGESFRQNQQLKGQGVPAGARAGAGPSRKRSSSAWCSASDDSSDTNASNPTELRDPLSLEQCRFCGEFNKDCVKVTSEKPYLVNNRTAFALNGVSVDLDFSDDTLPKAVCRYCDEKLQEIYEFVKLVTAAHDTLINVAEGNEEIETLVIKTEACSPTPEDNETKEGIVESVTVSEREFVKHSVFTHKRKNDNQICEKNAKKPKPKVINKPKPIVTKKVIAKQNKSKEECSTELIIDIKEEVIEKDVDSETGKDVNNDTETDMNSETQMNSKGSDKGSEGPSELEVATGALLTAVFTSNTDA